MIDSAALQDIGLFSPPLDTSQTIFQLGIAVRDRFELLTVAEQPVAIAAIRQITTFAPDTLSLGRVLRACLCAAAAGLRGVRRVGACSSHHAVGGRRSIAEHSAEYEE